MAAIGSFSLLRNCAVTQRAFSNVKVSQSAAFSFNSIKSFHRRLSQRSLLCSNAVHDEEASAEAGAAGADSGAPTMYHAEAGHVEVLGQLLYAAKVVAEKEGIHPLKHRRCC